MRIPAAVAVSALLVCALRAEEPGTAAPGKPQLDFSQYKSADAFWNQVEKLQQQPSGPRPASREEMLAQVRAWFSMQRAAVNAFLQAFPTDPRRWQAKMISLRAGVQLRRLAGETATLAEDAPVLDQIMSDPEAPQNVKGEAAFMIAAAKSVLIDPSKPETYAAFQEAAANFLAKFADHPLAGQMQSLQLRVLAADTTAESEEALKKLADSPDPQTAKTAKDIIAHRRQLEALQLKPIDLKYTAVDGREVNLANLRGKVVLVEFWASWCGPCVTEIPKLVAAYQKLHERGFEIVGVCLDKDRASMEAVIQKQGATWAQYFDGGGWENKISSGYGINSMPVAWLIDKKGMLRETNIRADAVAAGVEKLLAE